MIIDISRFHNDIKTACPTVGLSTDPAYAYAYAYA